MRAEVPILTLSEAFLACRRERKLATQAALRECEFHALKTPEERALMRQVRERIRALMDR